MFTRRIPQAVALLLAVPAAGRADLPDHEFQDRAQIQLRKLHLVPFPIYSQVPGKGYVGLNDGKVTWTGGARVYVPPGDYTRTDLTSFDGLLVTRVQVRGWQSDGLFDPVPGMAFVNVGWSVVTAGSEALRKGEYVVYEGGGFVKGSLRPPDPVRVEPRDTNREKASELLAEAFFKLNVQDLVAARATFRTVALEYSDTPAADRAVAALQRIGESGPRKSAGYDDPGRVPEAIFTKADGQSDHDAASHLVSLAIVYRASNQPARAKTVLRGLLDRYPDSAAAARARRVLDGLGG
jgi:Tetratricopeptide repeat